MGLEWKSMSKSADEKLFEDTELVPLESQSIEDGELVDLESQSIEDSELVELESESIEDSELVALESQSSEDTQLVALESETIEDTGTATPISRMILLKVCEYLKYHLEAHKPNSALTDDEIKTWDQEFINVDRDTLFDLHEVLFLKPSSNWEFDCYFLF